MSNVPSDLRYTPDHEWLRASGTAHAVGITAFAAPAFADDDDKADLWDIADGLLAGAVQYWLYSRQPCGDPSCEECLPISTAAGRIAELKRLIDQFSEESQYFHTPTDANVGRLAPGRRSASM